MTYQEIISQVLRRIGYTSFATIPKADIRFAIRWAESELTTEQKVVRKVHEITLTSDKTEYPEMPSDYSEPREIIILGEDGGRLEHVEVEYEEWVRWNPTGASELTENDVIRFEGTPEATIENSRLGNRVVVAINFDQSGSYRFYIKPGITGKAQIVYSMAVSVDPFASLTESPRIPEHLHHYIIPGATYFLAQSEYAKSVREKDYSGANFYKSISDFALSEFQLYKNKIRENTNARARPAVAKADPWYENPLKYR